MAQIFVSISAKMAQINISIYTQVVSIKNRHPKAAYNGFRVPVSAYLCFLAFQIKTLYCYFIQLHRDLREFAVEIKRSHTNSISAHVIAVVWLHSFIRPGIQKHSGNFMGHICQLGFLVFYVREDLVQIC